MQKSRKNNRIFLKTKFSIIEYLKFNNVFIFPTNMQLKKAIWGILNGGIVFIIIFNKSKKPSPFQVEFINHIIENGGIAFVAHSLEEVKFELKDYFL